jgi:hypothetical protein
MSKRGKKINACKEITIKENESLLLDMMIKT